MNYIIIYKELKHILKFLTEKERSELWDILFDYSDGLDIKLTSDNLRNTFEIIKPKLDSHIEKAKIKADVARRNGAAGGRKPNSKPKKPTSNPLKPTGFIQPTLEEVKNYCQERKNSVNPEKWFNFYSAKGWKIGKNTMKDWKAAVRTWENNQSTPQTNISSKPNPVKEFNTFMGEEFANRILEDSEGIKLFLRSPAYILQINSDNELKNKIESYFKNKKWELLCQ